MQLIPNYALGRCKLCRLKTILMTNLTFCLIFFAGLQVTARGLAQKVTLEEKNAKLERVLKKIENQTGYTFLFENSIIRKAAPVNVHIRGGSVEEALDQCLAGQSLVFKIFEKTVVIKEKKDAKNAIKTDASSEVQPPITIRGRVTNDKGEPVVGVSVTLKNTKTGAVTDTDGKYVITVPNNGILIFSSTGYVTKEVPVNHREAIDVQIELGLRPLNSVVVTAMGIKR